MPIPSDAAVAPVPDRLTPEFGKVSYVIKSVPLIGPMAAGKKLICSVRDDPAAICFAVPEKPVCVNGYVSVIPVTLKEMVPEFVMVRGCDTLVVPSAWLAKLKEGVLKVAMAVELIPLPLNVLFCAPAISKVAARVPVNTLAAVGAKVTVKLTHFPGAMVTGSPPLIWNTEDVEVNVLTLKVVLPRLYIVTACAVLVVPDNCGPKISPVGKITGVVAADTGRVAISIPPTTSARRNTPLITTP